MKVALMLVMATVAATAAMLVTPRLVLDGPQGVLFWTLDRMYGYDGTAVHGPAYSDWRFLAVREGMSCAEVEAMLGPALEDDVVSHDHPWFKEYGPGVVRGRRYVRGTRGSSYATRSVVFKDCVVVERVSVYRFD